jgi:hypothetical protein
VSPSPSPHLYPLHLESAHLPDALLDSILQRFDADVLNRRSLSRLASPAASLLLVWKQSRSAITLTRSPWPPARRRDLAVAQRSSHRHQSRPLVRIAGDLAGNLTRNGEVLLFLFFYRWISIWCTRLVHLSEQVSADLDHPLPFRSSSSHHWSKQTGTGLSWSATCQLLVKMKFKIELWIIFQTNLAKFISFDP